MKNEDIHKEFGQREIRDFLAKELKDSMMEAGLVSVGYAEEQIEHFQKILKYAKKFEATKYLMTEKGWDDWDISNDILYNRETYFAFIGTEEEYNKLMDSLKKEKRNE